MTDEQLLEILERCPRLRSLELKRTRITDLAYERILAGAGPALERIWRDPAIDPSMRARAKLERPGLIII